MKKLLVVILLFVIFSFSLFARPQFFLGCNLDWGRMYPSEEEDNILRDEGLSNRYYDSMVYNTDEKELEFISNLTPSLSLTYIPFASFGLGIKLSAGYGFITGRGINGDTYSYYNNSWDNIYSFSTDNLLLLSAGLSYIHLIDSDRYISLGGFAGFEYRAYTLLKNKGGDDFFSIKEKLLSFSVSLLERYDGFYFALDARALKDASTLFSSSGFSYSITASIGVVFTILNENQFMN